MSTDFIPEFDRDVPSADAIPVTMAPSRKRLESGIVQADVEALVPGRSSRQGLFQVAATFRVTSPAEFAGAQIWENFVIGDKEDSDATELATWGRTVGGSRFRRLADRMKVPFGKLSAMTGAMLKRPVVLDMYTFVEPPKNKDGSDNTYAGKVRRNVREFYAVGEKALAARGRDFTPADAGNTTALPMDGAAPITCPMCNETTTAAEFETHAAKHESVV